MHVTDTCTPCVWLIAPAPAPQVNSPAILSVKLLPWPAVPLPASSASARASDYDIDSRGGGGGGQPQGIALSLSGLNQTACPAWLVVPVPMTLSGMGQVVPPGGSQATVGQLGLKAYGGLSIAVGAAAIDVGERTAIDGVQVNGRVLYPSRSEAYYAAWRPNQ